MERDNLLAGYKVLYVEDDETHREQLKMFLKRRVGKLFIGKNGTEGLELFKKENPDIVVTDLRMPSMDGIAMSKEIRELDKICPIIVTTAFSDVETILGAVDVGITKYVLKPINTDELLASMREGIVNSTEIKGKDLIVNNKLIRTRQERLEYENKIRIKMASFIKGNTGKGPKVVKAFIKGNQVEIEGHDTLTQYERKLLEHKKNERLVRFSREAFYGDNGGEIEGIVKEVLGVRCNLINIEIDLEHNKDNLVVSIDG